MSLKAYIDFSDLLILSYYDRILCTDSSGSYVIVSLHECPDYQDNLKNFMKSGKNDPKLRKNNAFLVNLDDADANILRNWGHGVSEDQKQIIVDGYPYFARQSPESS